MSEKLTGYPSIDKPWQKYHKEDNIQAQLQEYTVYKNIYENNKNNLNDIAICYFNKKISYSLLFENIEKCAKSLKTLGVKEGDCVSLCSAGTPEALYITLACSKIGAIANLINPLFTKEQKVNLLNNANSDLIFVLDEMYSYIKDSLFDSNVSKVIIIPVYQSMPLPIKTIVSAKGKSKKILKENNNCELIIWQDFINLGINYNKETEISYKKDMAVIMVYSSGTTGASKGIVLTNDGVRTTYYNRNIPTDSAKRGETFLQMIPIWFSTGIVISVIVPLLCGFTVIPEIVFSKESFFNDLKKYKPNMTLTATSLWLHVVSDYSNDLDLSNMTCPITGGEKVLLQDEKKINEFFSNHGCKTKIFKGYGMCELGGTVTSSSSVGNYKNKYGGAGYPIRNVIVSSFDLETNKELKYGELGEIRVFTPGRMLGYYKNEEATKHFFYTDKEGRKWGCTGDIGYIDKNGELFVLGRATDSATLENGKRIYLFEIENIIMQEESLSGCKVVQINNNGEKSLVAHLTLRENLNISNENLIKKIFSNCKEKLPIYEVPTKYKIRDSFPVHTNGKRDVSKLKEEIDGFIEVK